MIWSRRWKKCYPLVSVHLLGSHCTAQRNNSFFPISSESSKPGVNVTVLSLEPQLADSTLNEDFSFLVLQALPAGFQSVVCIWHFQFPISEPHDLITISCGSVSPKTLSHFHTWRIILCGTWHFFREWDQAFSVLLCELAHSGLQLVFPLYVEFCMLLYGHLVMKSSSSHEILVTTWMEVKRASHESCKGFESMQMRYLDAAWSNYLEKAYKDHLLQELSSLQ